jgi:DNA gyrase subunit B
MAYTREPVGDEYGPDNIEVLPGLEPIRLRPAMYVGDTGLSGLVLLVSELLDCAVGEFRAGLGERVQVDLLANGGYRISDDGRPLSLEVDPQRGRSPLELELSYQLAAGLRSAQQRTYSAPGLHGIGLCTANALAERLDLEVRRDGKLWRQECSRGALVGSLQEVGTAETTGVTITFWPDPLIFTKERVIPTDWFEQRLRELAFLHSGLTLYLVNHRDGPARRISFHSANGPADFVRHINHAHKPAHATVIPCRARQDGMEVEAALQWTTDTEERCRCYANAYFTTHGGTHVTALRHAVTRCVGDYLRGRGLVQDAQAAPTGEDCRSGLTAVVAVSLQEPIFSGARRERLHNPEVEGLVRNAVSAGLMEFFRAHPEDAEAIATRVLAACAARLDDLQNELIRRPR